MVPCVIMMIVLFSTEVSAQCNHGEVRLQDGTVPSEGRVEVCACIMSSCSWGTVCDDGWGENEAKAVCRQLGYRPNGAQALSNAYFGQGHHDQDILLDNVKCCACSSTLLECEHNGLSTHNCNHREDASVRCNGDKESLRIKNVGINIIGTPDIGAYTAMITWELKNMTITRYQPTSYEIECISYNEWHRIEISVTNVTFSTKLVGLLPSISYNCCVSAVYESYTVKGVCIVTATPPPSETSVIQPGSCNTLGMGASSANTIGGVLGFIIAILLTLLAISGSALVYLLRQKFLGNVNPNVSVDGNSTDLPVRRNLSYAITPPHSTTSGPQTAQATRAVGQSETDDAADYSRIGPPYETTDLRRQQPAVAITGRSQISSRLSERYEFSEAHLAVVGGDGDGQDEAVVDYEVPQNLSIRQISEEHEEYSHLQY